MDAAATINFKSGEARRLFEGGYYLRTAFIMYIPVNCQNSGHVRRTIDPTKQWRAKWNSA